MALPVPNPLFDIRCERPWLVATFARPQTALSWAMARPGFQTTDRVAWLEVRNADLPVEVDAFALLEARLREVEFEEAVAMMTARDVRLHHLADAASGDIRARCLATVGLRNGGRVGAPPGPGGLGTINLLAAVSCALTDAALVEALSIATEARNAVVMDLGWRVGGAVATGTGTDCVVMCAPIPPLARGGWPASAGRVGIPPDRVRGPSKAPPDPSLPRRATLPKLRLRRDWRPSASPGCTRMSAGLWEPPFTRRSRPAGVNGSRSRVDDANVRNSTSCPAEPGIHAFLGSSRLTSKSWIPAKTRA